jgi:hypothetical protein
MTDISELRTELLFEVKLDLDRENMHDLGATPHGHRRIVPVIGGSFTGPKLNGEVLPVGADWLLIRPDGAKEMDARITLCTDDREFIYMTYRGVDTGSPEVARRLASGEIVDPSEYYFRIQPFFETGSSKYGWLNRIVSVGFGKRVATALGYTVYAVL